MQCPECGQQTNSQRTCDACGCILPRRRGARPSAARADGDVDDARARALINRQLGKALQTLRTIRGVYIVTSIILGITTVVFAWLAWVLLTAGGSDGVAPAIAAIAMAALSLASTVVSLLGSVRIERNPLLWTVVMAVLLTFVALLAGLMSLVWLLLSPYMTTLMLLVSAFVASTGWFCVWIVAPVRRLMEEHPDLRIASRLRGEHAQFGESAARRHARDRRRAEAAGTWRSRLPVLGGLAAVALLVVTLVSVLGGEDGNAGTDEPAAAADLPPGPVEPAITAFAEAFNRVDDQAIAALARETSAPRLIRGMRTLLANAELDEPRAKLGAHRVERRGSTRFTAYFDVVGHEAEVETRWAWDGQRWVWRGLRIESL